MPSDALSRRLEAEHVRDRVRTAQRLCKIRSEALSIARDIVVRGGHHRKDSDEEIRSRVASLRARIGSMRAAEENKLAMLGDELGRLELAATRVRREDENTTATADDISTRVGRRRKGHRNPTRGTTGIKGNDGEPTQKKTTTECSAVLLHRTDDVRPPTNTERKEEREEMKKKKASTTLRGWSQEDRRALMREVTRSGLQGDDDRLIDKVWSGTSGRVGREEIAEALVYLNKEEERRRRNKEKLKTWKESKAKQVEKESSSVIFTNETESRKVDPSLRAETKERIREWREIERMKQDLRGLDLLSLAQKMKGMKPREPVRNRGLAADDDGGFESVCREIDEEAEKEVKEMERAHFEASERARMAAELARRKSESDAASQISVISRISIVGKRDPERLLRSTKSREIYEKTKGHKEEYQCIENVKHLCIPSWRIVE